MVANSGNVDELRDELERVRAEGLRQMEGWDAERQEGQRLRQVAERFRAQAVELRRELEEMTEARDLAHTEIDTLRQHLQVSLDRVERLLKAVEGYAQHERRCKYNPKKPNTECTCGLGALLIEPEESSP